MRAIDTWAQIPTPRMLERPWLAPLFRWTNGAASVQQSAESTVEAMDRAGVEIALLSAWYGPEGCLISNEEVAEAVAQFPDRLRGVASADITQPMEAVRELRRWLADDGFVAARIVPWLWDLPPNDRKFYPIYTTCIEFGVPLCTQIGHTGPLRPSEVGRPIPYLEQVMLDFPELVVVGGHVGFPWVDELTTMAIKFENFHVDTSAYAVRRLPRSFVEWMTTIGQDRVMFGTNWPMLDPEDCLRGLEKLGLSDEQRDKFTTWNAKRVFGL